ncbi:choice-of-anchor D domain-containing protein [bacterium]|nr:choice-of-anchor D domain-containing protein [bacterium]
MAIINKKVRTKKSPKSSNFVSILQVLDEVEDDLLSITEAKHKYGIKGYSADLKQLKMRCRFNWSNGTAKIILALVCLSVLLITQIPAQAEYFFINSYSNSNPQKNEISFVSFDDNFNYKDISENSLQLSMDGENVPIDSILFFNSSIEKKASIFIAIEYSSAINNTDLDLIQELLDFYSNYEDTAKCEITIALFSDYPISIKNPQDKQIRNIDNLTKLKIYPKPNIEKLLKSSFFQNFVQTAKFSEHLLVISKSKLEFDKQYFTSLIQDNQIKLSNIKLPNGLNSNLNDLINLTSGDRYRINNNIEKIKYLSYFNIFNDNYYKIYYHYDFCSGKHISQLKVDSLQDSVNFTIYPNEIADIFPKCNYLDFGKIDTGRIATNEIIFQVKNANLWITSITSSDSLFKILLDYKNVIIQKDSLLHIPIQYYAIDTLFHQSEILITGKNCQTFKFFTYAGLRPSNEVLTVNFISPKSSDILFANEKTYIKWLGSHPDDTLSLEYRLKDEHQWKSISQVASNNCFEYLIPDIDDTTMQFQLSISKRNWVSDKVIQLIGHKARITDICWSPDDQELISSSEDGKIYLWNTKTGQLIKALFQSQLSIISGIDLSKDGKYIAIAANDSVIKIWDKENEFLYRELHCTEMIKKIKFSYDGTTAIGISSLGNIFIWNVNSSALLNHFYSQSTQINVLAVNPTKNIFATASKDGKINIWNITTGSLIKNIFSSNFEILDLKWIPSGTILLFSGNDSKIRIYDIEQDRIIQTIFDTEKPVNAVDWCATYPYVLSSNKNFINLWRSVDAKFLNQYDQHNLEVYRINSSNETSKIASVDNSHTIQIWSVDDFPFERPKIILDTTALLPVINKRFFTPNLVLPLCQVGDTLYLYYDNFVQNITTPINDNEYQSTLIQIDSIFQPIQNPTYSIYSNASPFYIDYNMSSPIGLQFTPKSNHDFSTTISTASGIKTINSNVQVSILEENLNKKAYFIDFGNVALGNFKDTLFYLFQNISTQSVSLDSVRFFYDSSFILISPAIPFNMNAKGGVFVPTVRFQPKSIGYSSALALFYFHNGMKLYCNFSGYSTGPRLEAPSEILFDTLICEDSISKQLTLYNSGTNLLKIKNITIENNNGNNFKILSNVVFDLAPNESKNLDIEFATNNAGDYDARLKIATNLQNNSDTISFIKLLAIKETILLDTFQQTVIFNAQNDSERIQKIIEVKNLGSLLSNFKIINNPTGFAIDSVIYNYPISKIYCSFLGGENRKDYIDSILLQDECSKIYIVGIRAYVNNKIAILSTVNKIDLGLIACSDEQVVNLPIVNQGDTTLILDNITLKNNTNFTVSSNFPIEILPNHSVLISIQFEISQEGNYYDTLMIETNANNSADGFIYIPIESERKNITIEVSDESIKFDSLNLNQKDSISFYIINKSQIPTSITLKSTNPNFILNQTFQSIPPNDSIHNEIIYLGRSSAGNDLGEIIIQDTCSKEYIIQIEASVIEAGEVYSVSLLQPNPADKMTNIEITSNSSIFYQIKIYDLQGKIISEFPRVDNFTGFVRIPINTQKIASGVYIVEINTSKEKAIRKLIKLK